MKKNVKVLTCTALSLMLSQTAVWAADDSEDDTKKDETVYAMLNADGTVYDEIISGWLHNDAGIKNIKETLEVKAVENVKGDEEPQVEGNTYTWNVEGSDVYYRGNSDKKLPVEVKITYYLNGKITKPEELAGKSGKLEIHIEMTNQVSTIKNINGVPTTIHPLYLAAGVIDFSNDHFTNVSCKHAKVLSEGNHQILTFFAIPGMEDTLHSAGIDNDSLPIKDSFVIKADVKDFELGPIMIAMTPDLPLDEIKDIDSLNELTGGIDQLQSAGSQLLDGTNQLSQANHLFASKMNELYSGAKPLSDGITQLNQGAQQLNSGMEQVANGIHMINDQAVASGQLTQLKNVLNSLKSLAPLAENAEMMLGGLQQLNASLNQANINPADGSPLGSVSAYASGTAAAAKSTAEGIGALCMKLQAQGITDPTLLSECQTVAGQAVQSAQGAGVMDAIINGEGGMAQQVSAMATAVSQIDISQITTIAAQFGMIDQANAALTQLEQGITQLDQGITPLSAGAQQLAAGTQALASNTPQLTNGISQLNSASATLALKTGELNQGMTAFKTTGLDVLSNRVNLTMDELNRIMAIKNEITAQNETVHTFTGAPKNAETKVKFIYKTDEIKQSKAEAEEESPIEKEDESLWQRVMNFFTNLL